MRENWTKWNPANIAGGQFFVREFVQNAEGTKIILSDEDNVVEIFFDGVPPLVRSSVEGLRMRTWGEVQSKYNDKYYFRNWFLYLVENSKLAKWAEEESCGFYEAKQFKHYCVVTGEELIDVISPFAPSVNVAKEVQQ